MPTLPAFLILGYGVPEKDILQDEQYRRYIIPVLNHIFRTTEPGKSAVIVFSGGPTKAKPPFEQTEAGEMQRLFRSLIDRDAVLMAHAVGWGLMIADTSLSSLENLLLSKKVLAERQFTPQDLVVFCEYTREHIVATLARQIFGLPQTQVAPIDFDISPRRYTPADTARLEQGQLERSLLALQHPDLLQLHHELFEEKIALLRQTPAEQWGSVYRAWLDRSAVKFMSRAKELGLA